MFKTLGDKAGTSSVGQNLAAEFRMRTDSLKAKLKYRLPATETTQKNIDLDHHMAMTDRQLTVRPIDNAIITSRVYEENIYSQLTQHYKGFCSVSSTSFDI